MPTRRVVIDRVSVIWRAASSSTRVPSRPLALSRAAETREQVDAFHAAAIAGAGRDNGAPGLRPEYSEHYYGAFVLDADGHNIEAVHNG